VNQHQWDFRGERKTPLNKEQEPFERRTPNGTETSKGTSFSNIEDFVKHSIFCGFLRATRRRTRKSHLKEKIPDAIV